MSFRRAVFCSVGVFATLALSTGIAAASPILTYQVTTTGCFNCTTAGPFTDIASYSGYTFEGVASNGTTDASGNATVSLGGFDRTQSSDGNYDDLPNSTNGNDFVLRVSFLNPLGIGSGADEFVATIVGTQGQPGDLTFDNLFTTYTFTNQFGTGSFEFRLNDILKLNKNDWANLTGQIQNATFIPTGFVDGSADPTPVPEPASLVLLGSGLVVAARQVRRRASK